MKGKSKRAEDKAIEEISLFMSLAARTSPKTKGIDNVVTAILKKPTLNKIIKEMVKIAQKQKLPTFSRDAENLKQTDVLVLIGVKNNPAGIPCCGFCGYKNCSELIKAGGICTFNLIDLGISLGSAVTTANRLHVDNRIMYSVGKVAIKLNLFKDKKVKQAIGIPLSATGKNIYFDRPIY